MSIDFRIKDFFYPNRIWKLHRKFEANQWLSPEELEKYQLARLKAVLTHAFQEVPYYGKLFRSIGFHPSDVTRIEHIRELPILDKDTIRAQFDSLQSREMERYSPVKARTSGSSGKPLEFYLDRSSQALEFVYYWRHWRWAGYRLGDLFAELSSHYFLIRPAMDQLDTHYQVHLRRLLLNSNRMSRGSCIEMAKQIRRLRPRFLKGISSALYFFALNLRGAGITDLKFDCIFSTGEIITPLYRQVIEEVFHSKILDSYGHMERTVAISQCPEGGYHVNSDYGLLETVPDESGREKVVSVVGTSLHNFAMPLIRYDTGDQVEHESGFRSCPCGRTLPLIRSIQGRSEDVIITPDGRFLTTLFIVPELVSGVDFIQFVQTSGNELEIRVVPGNQWNEDESTRLQNYTRRMTGDSMRVRICPITNDDLLFDRSGKIRNVIRLYDSTREEYLPSRSGTG